MSKEGSTIGGLMDFIGTLTSISLQYGVPLEEIVNKARNQKFEPHGLVYEGHKEIKTATSLIDYIFHALNKFFNESKESDSTMSVSNKLKKLFSETNNNEINNSDYKKNKSPKVKNVLEQLGGFCPVCGSRMIIKGHCEERCSNSECNFISLSGCGE